jgi:exopolyphosphatase/guanosine-5'-triphosphate,3'-diphosphate pyrophosphatase
LRKKLFKGETDDLVTVDEIGKLIDKLSRMTYEERVRKMRLRPDRADVLLPAAVVLRMIAKEVRAKHVHIPGVGLKDGILLEMVPVVKGPDLPRREQVWASAVRLGQKYKFDSEHSLLIARLAAKLFNQSLSLHHLTEKELLLLEVASLLHDIGHFINTIDHDRHGYYLLKHNQLVGLTEEQQEIVANVVRYHRKDDPSTADGNFKALSQKNRLVVTKLCAIMRLADALDTSHTGRVRDVILEQQKKQWRLIPVGEDALMLEKWSLEKRKALFQDVFGITLMIESQ